LAYVIYYDHMTLCKDGLRRRYSPGALPVSQPILLMHQVYWQELINDQ